jgi:hypothetical protein
MAQLPRGFVYELSPIDEWMGWSEHEDVAAEYREELERTREHAVEQIRSRSGWEGDISRGPLYAGVPRDDPWSAVMVAIKQSNNGRVFIWSPVDLPWLAKFRTK